MDVDIVIIARNEETFLPRCLDSLQSQDYENGTIGIVVIDNNSTDRTKLIAEERGVQVLSCPERCPAILRNRGIERGTAPAVAFLDAHCIPHQQWLSLMTSAMFHPSIGGVQGATTWYDDRERPLSEATSSARLKGSIYGSRSILPWILTGNALYLREALERVDGFTEELIRCEDTDLSWKILLKGYYIAYQKDAFLSHYEKRGVSRYKTLFLYGRGAAALRKRYAFLGTYNHTREDLRKSSRFYRLGHCYGSIVDTIEQYKPTSESGLRPWFAWDDESDVRISSETVAWFLKDRWIAKTGEYKEQVVMDESACAIWGCLLKEMSRSAVIECLGELYQVPASEIREDLTLFMDSLLSEKLIELRTSHHEMNRVR